MTIAGAPDRYRTFEFEAESSFGNIEAFSSPTRLETISPIDTSTLTQEKIVQEFAQQRPNEGRAGVKGPIGGEITFDLYLTGHGGTTVGALTLTDLATILGGAIGSVHSANVGSDASGVPTVSNIPTTAGVFADSTLARIGSLNDGRGNGQVVAVASEASNVLTLLTALGVAPIATDEVGGMLVIHPNTDPCELATTYRLRTVSPNGQYEMFGCSIRRVTISNLNPGELPRVSLTFGVASWRPPTAPITFPLSSATDAKQAVPVGGGSFFLQGHGTVTNQLFTLRQFEVEINIEVREDGGYGGDHPQQVVERVVVIGNSVRVKAWFDKPVAGTETFDDLWLEDGAEKHALATFSTGDGTTLALYLQKAVLRGARPVQQSVEGRNSVMIELESIVNNVNSSDARVRADWMLGMG